MQSPPFDEMCKTDASSCTSAAFSASSRLAGVSHLENTRALEGIRHPSLRSAEYDVDEAVDGREALAKVLSRRYDIIVLETRLPGIDGYHLCNLLRHDLATHKIAIVVVTGDWYAADLDRAHQRGDTLEPRVAPPALVCPSCDRPLVYRRSHAGGVRERQSEQWDYDECTDGCGTFQYRQRTRKLQRV